jgi:ribonuclease-3
LPSRKTQNFKGVLLEYCQSKGLQLPNFKVIKEIGPEHNKHFVIEVLIDGKVYGKGHGKTKKEASQRAAEETLNQLNPEILSDFSIDLS